MPANLARCLLKDYMYQQDESMQYIFRDDKFVLVNRDEIADAILESIDAVFERYFEKNIISAIECTYDSLALNRAMCRYSRDVFGEKRLHARVLHFREKYKIQDEDTKELISYEDYGIKIDSHSPYIHRRIANLFYWFAMLKPFRADVKATVPENENTYVFFEYHNEFVTYILVMMVLASVGCTINIHENDSLFRQFLYDLHFRNLSRSALEFFLNNHIQLA
ncbi:MAG: hypothetical protein FWC64_02635 [Treponema sp.]|nr:hypothetical protein [Treponema sp.]